MRSEFCQKLNEGMEEKFPEWFGEAEVPKWKYFSSFLNKEKEEIIKKYLEKRVSDKENGHTQMGIHRDDFQIYQQEQAVFPKLSQGQQKTLVLVIKMIEIDLVNRLHGLKPVLLLDDLTSELDPDRRKTFFKALNESFGQVILSTTERRYYQKIKNINFINLK